MNSHHRDRNLPRPPEAAFDSGHRWLRKFLRRSRDGIIVLDDRGTIVEWNDEEERITGISRAAALGRAIWDVQQELTPEENRTAERLEQNRERALAGLNEGIRLGRTLEDDIQRPDGSRRTVQSRLFAIRSDGRLFAGGISRDITERKRVEQELRASEERLALAIAGSGQGLWDWDISADKAYLSPEFLRMCGYAEGDLGPAQEFFRKIVHPDDLPLVEAAIRKHLRGDSGRVDVEYRMWSRSGREIWIRGMGQVTARDENGAPLRMTGVITDITERKHLQEELRERQALLLEAERLVHLGHWDRDLRTGVSTWSDEVYRMFGHEPGAYPPGRPAFLESVAPEDRQRVGDAVTDTARDGITRRMEYRVVTSQGVVHYLDAIVELLRDAKGNPARVIGTVQDITERKTMEREFAEANRRKDEFLAMLAHELRNPLAPIRTSLYVMAHTPPGGEQAQRMQAIIERQVVQLTRLVDDLLDVSRVARGKIQLHPEPVDFCGLLERTIEDNRSVFKAGGILLETRVPPRPVWLVADPARIAQIVGNLLGNAAKFTPEGGRVEVTLERDGADAVLKVCDTGAGIARDTLERLFEPFMQADRTLDRAGGGLGLGLALVKGLAELHGGSVAAASPGPGQGAEFTVRLPMASEAREVVAPGRRRPVRPRRVLVIEDNVDAAVSLKEALEIDHHAVQMAHNGPDGIARARVFRPEVVLCDIGLPGMDGYEIAQAFRADETLRDTFLVALTGYSLPEDLQRAMQAGFDRHLTKPPSVEALDELIAQAPEPAPG